MQGTKVIIWHQVKICLKAQWKRMAEVGIDKNLDADIVAYNFTFDFGKNRLLDWGMENVGVQDSSRAQLSSLAVAV